MRFAFRVKIVFCVIGLLLCASGQAQSPVEVSNAWARATVPAQTVGGVYMDIRSATSARLVGAATSAAARAEIHNMTMENGVMKMSPVNGIELPAGQSVKLAPGGYHVMLLDLKQPLKAGDSVPVTLTIERADKSRTSLDVKAEVRAINAGAPSTSGMHKGH